jgi:hypothetical protein
MLPPNGLPFSRVAPIDRDNIVADSDCQNATDLVDAQRHRLEWRVGRPDFVPIALSTAWVKWFFMPTIHNL